MVMVISAGRSADGRVDHVRIDAGKAIRIVAALAQNMALLGVAKVREIHFVELQIAASCARERLHRGTIGQPQIAVEVLHVRVDIGADGPPPAAEMQDARRRNGHLRHSPGVLAEEAEMLDHRVRGEAQLAGNAQALGLGFNAAFECDPVIGAERFHTV
jgi:hypothetical protein